MAEFAARGSRAGALCTDETLAISFARNLRHKQNLRLFELAHSEPDVALFATELPADDSVLDSIPAPVSVFGFLK